MKRVLIILCCICLIICLAAPALAAVIINWQDYIVSTTPGFDYDTNDVFIPASAGGFSWSATGLTDASTSGSSIYFSYDGASGYHAIGLSLNDLRINLADIDMQDTISFYFNFTGFPDDSFKIKYTTKYFDADSKPISNIYGTWTDVDGSGSYVVPVDITIAPEGSVYVAFVFEVYVNYLPAGDYSIDYVGLSFDVLTPGTLTKPAPITIHPQDYIVNESSNGDASTLYVSVPSSDLDILWNTLRNDDFSVLYEFSGNPYNVDLPVADYGYWIGCQVFDKLDITDIVNGSTLEVDFNIDYPSGVAVPYGFPVRYQVRYYDINGVLVDSVRFFTLSGNYGLDNTTLNMVIDKPDGAVSMTFILQYMDIPVTVSPYEFTLELESVNFVCDIPTMVRVQQETGKTNKLLDELVNGDHGFDSSGSNFGSEADQLAGAGDQMNNAMGSGMNSLGSMTNSVAFTGTLTTLAGVMDAVFVGHEITICGVTANPFTLLVSIFAIAILLPLGLKFVFRKWGSGGG